MWPFGKKRDAYHGLPDQPTASAIAIADSLRKEPERWVCADEYHLRHDSGVIIGVAGWTWFPNLEDEPDANGDAIAEAVDDWVAAQVTRGRMAQEPRE